MDKGVGEEQYITTAKKVDDAEGVSNIEKREWFVAIVNNHSEKKYAQVLYNEEYETFVPIQSEKHTWRNGTLKVIDRVLIAAVIFIHCTENERKEIVKKTFVKRFMVDRTRKDKNGNYPIAKIPGCQIDTFRNLLNKADEPIIVESLPLNIGDKVRVVRGKLAGIEGRILRQKCGETFLIVEISLLGYAKLDISLGDVEKIDF